MSALAKERSAAELEEASAWRARIAQDPETAESPAFLTWLERPDNNARYAAVERTWDVLDEIAASPAMLAARQVSLRALRDRTRGAALRGRATAGLAVAASLLVAILVGLHVYRQSFVFQTYETAAMERRVVILADGSRVALDSETRLDLRYTPGERRLTLAHGQANFTVAHEADRPFRVLTPSRVVVATGTRFNVDLFGARTIVTLAEGRVVVSHLAPSGEKRAVALNPGQALLASGEADSVRQVDTAQANAWEQGKVVFDDEQLPAAIARFNRYAHRRWRVDPALSTLKISGVFDTADADAFLEALTAYFGLEARVASDGSVVLTPASAGVREKKIVAAR